MSRGGSCPREPRTDEWPDDAEIATAPRTPARKRPGHYARPPVQAEAWCTWCGERHRCQPCRVCPDCLGHDAVRFHPYTGERLDARPAPVPYDPLAGGCALARV